MNDGTHRLFTKGLLIGVFTLVALAMSAGGYWFYRQEMQAIRSKEYYELKAIGEMKVGEIVAWRQERLADARLNSSGLLRTCVLQWLKAPDDDSLKVALLDHLNLFQDAEHYENIALTFPDSRLLLSLDTHLTEMEDNAKRLIAQAVASHEALFGDLFLSPASQKVYLDIAAPIPGEDNRPAAVLILRTDPAKKLYPLIQSWPTPTTTAESILTRKDGDEALFLCPLRHRPDPPMTLRIPLSRSDLPTSQAALGKTGEFLGRDYRGVDVLADIRPVPGSSWFMVTKADTSEVLAEVRYRSRVIVGYVALGILMSGVMMGFLFYFAQADLYQELFRASRLESFVGPTANEATLRAARKLTRAAAVVVIATGGMVLFGWLFDITSLKSVLPGFVAMKPNTAVGFVLAGLSLSLTGRAAHSARTRVLVLVCAGATALLGLLTLSQYLFGLDFGIDQLLFRTPAGTAGTPLPGRMAPASAINFVLLGSALLLIGFRRAIPMAQPLALLAVVMGLPSLLGYLYGVRHFYGIGTYTHMAIHTAAAFVILGLGVLLANPAGGVMRIFTSDAMGGFMLRRLTPIAVGAPIVLGWLRAQGEQRGYVESSFGVALMMVVLMVLLTGVTWWSAQTLSRVDLVRREAEANMGESEARYRALFDCSPDALMTVAPPSWKFTSANQAMLDLFVVKDAVEFASLSPWDLSPEIQPDGRPSAEKGREMIETAMRKGTHSFEWTHKRRNGEDFPATVLLSRIKVTGEELLQATVRDITERKRAEDQALAAQGELQRLLETANQSRQVLLSVIEDQRRAEEVLQENQRKYQSLYQEFQGLLNGIPDPLVLLSQDLRIVWANTAAAAEFGQNPSDVIGQHCYRFRRQRSEPCESCPVARTFRSGKLEFEETSTPDGRIWDLRAIPVLGEQGETKVVIELARNITERMQAEKAAHRQAALMEAGKKVLEGAVTGQSYAEVGRVCLAVSIELTGSQFGFIGEINPVGSFDTIAMSDPGWDACTIPGSNAARMIEGMHIRGIWGRVLRSERPEIVNNPADHPDRVGIPEGHPLLTSFLGVPLKRSGNTIGMVALANKEGGYTLDDQENIESLSAVFMGALLHKQAQVALKESEEEYRALFDSSHDAIMLFDEERFIDGNPATLVAFGCTSQDDLRSRHPADFSPPQQPDGSDSYGAANEHIARALDRGFEAFQWTHRRLDGTLFPTEITLSRIVLRGKSLVLAIIRDVSESRKALEALERSEGKYRTLFEQTRDPIVMTSRKGAIIDANHAALTLFGYKREELLAFEHVARLFHDDSERLKLARLLQENGFVGNYEMAYRKQDGTKLDCFVDITPRTDPQGRVVGHQGIVRDVTEYKQLQAQLFQAQKMEAVGRLSGSIAHDFNNLLTVIRGNAELAMKKVEKEPLLQRLITPIHEASLQAAGLTSQLLLFSRKLPAERKPVDLNSVLQDRSLMLQRLIGEDIRISFDPVPSPWTIVADRGRVEQVIMNLVVNARDAMPKGGRLTLTTTKETVDAGYCRVHSDAQPGKYLCLSVTDTGTGIDKEVMSKMFEPFFTTKGPEKGTGLGLAVVYGVVKDHGGWINVYSELGMGTTFRVYLPAYFETKGDEPAEELSREACPGRGQKILIVEDEKPLRDLARMVLTEGGYTVVTAKSAEEAIEVFEREKGEFELVFSDMVLPGKSGLDVVEELRAGKPSLRVLLCSGYTDEKSQWPVIQEKGYTLLHKPYAVDNLLKAVKDALEEHRA